MTTNNKGKYLSVEMPDQKVTVDFLSFNPEKGIKVPGCSVRLSIEYKKGEARINVTVIDDGGSNPIVLDVSKELIVDEIE